MKDWQQRVVDEMAELDARRDRLNAFMHSGAAAPSRGPAQAAPDPGTCHCPAGLGAYLCAQCWPQ